MQILHYYVYVIMYRNKAQNEWQEIGRSRPNTAKVILMIRNKRTNNYTSTLTRINDL